MGGEVTMWFCSEYYRGRRKVFLGVREEVLVVLVRLPSCSPLVAGAG